MIADIIEKVNLSALDELELNQMEYDLSRAVGRVQNTAVKTALSDLMNHVSYTIDGASGEYVPEYRLKAAPDFDYVNKLDFSGLTADEIALAVAAIDKGLVLVAGDRVVTRGLTALKGVLVSDTTPAPVAEPVAVASVASVASGPAGPAPEPVPVPAPAPAPKPEPVPVPSPVPAPAAVKAAAVVSELSLDAYLASAVRKMRRGKVHGTITITVSLDV